MRLMTSGYISYTCYTIRITELVMTYPFEGIDVIDVHIICYRNASNIP